MFEAAISAIRAEHGEKVLLGWVKRDLFDRYPCPATRATATEALKADRFQGITWLTPADYFDLRRRT